MKSDEVAAEAASQLSRPIGARGLKFLRMLDGIVEKRSRPIGARGLK